MPEAFERWETTRSTSMREWSQTLVEPLLGKLRAVHQVQSTDPEQSEAITHALWDWAFRGAPRENAPEERFDCYVQLLLSCMALLEGRAQAEATPGTAAPAAGAPAVPGDNRVERLRAYLGEQDFQTVMTGVELRHALVQNRDVDLRVLATAATALYEAVRIRFPTLHLESAPVPDFPEA